MTIDQPAPATPAATIVLLRDGHDGLEVLLLQRSGRGFFGGMWVFPGGQVDASDSGDLAGHDREVAAARRAAVREAREEAGVDLDPDSLVVHSWWVAPPGTPRRFATWFFVAPAVGEAEVVVDGAEIVGYRWLTPGDAIARRDLGEIVLVPPTWMTLWWLREQPDVSTALDAARGRPVARFETRFAADGDRQMVMWEGDAGWARGDPAAPGPRRRLWMEPAGWRAEVSAP